MVAVPFSPANGVPVGEVGKVPLNQILMGACTNGRLEDIAVIAGILKGKKVKHGLKCILYPAFNVVYEAAREGYLETLAEAGSGWWTVTSRKKWRPEAGGFWW